MKEAEIKNSDIRGKIICVLDKYRARGHDLSDSAQDMDLATLLVEEGLVPNLDASIRTLGRVREFSPIILKALQIHNPESTPENAFVNCLVFGVSIANPKPANQDGPIKVLIGNGQIFVRFKE
ncbi:hypothetical protein HYU90_00405 [Candidatus Collierbacteria bacterium]|nr:hypothetical protein [Candidatus Collierbacteria bacterium]